MLGLVSAIFWGHGEELAFVAFEYSLSHFSQVALGEAVAALVLSY